MRIATFAGGFLSAEQLFLTSSRSRADNDKHNDDNCEPKLDGARRPGDEIYHAAHYTRPLCDCLGGRVECGA